MKRTNNSKSISILSKQLKSATRVSSIFLSVKECEALLVKEGWSDKMDTDVYTVFCGLNTWCGLFQDITGKSGEILATEIRLRGLDKVIRDSESFRLSLLAGVADRGSFWYRFVYDEVSSETLTLVGQCRRLRIVGKGATDEIEAFLHGNTKCRNHNRYDTIDIYKPYHSVGKGLWSRKYRDSSLEVPDLFDQYGTKDKVEWLKFHTHTPEFLLDEASRLWGLIFKNWKQDISKFILPPGVSSEGARTYLEKFKIVCEQQCWLRERGVNLPILRTNRFSEPLDYCRYQLVPKTFKSMRGIAPEPVSKQVLGYQVDYGMRNCLKELGVDLSDQTRNQVFSSDLANATKDISAASDSISFFLVDRLSQTTPLLRARLMDIRSPKVLVEGKLVENYRFATMGNTCTFSTESAIFLIICIICWELYYGVYVNDYRSLKRLCRKLFAIYGDDCVLPAQLSDLFDQICEFFGFSVNIEKSYGTGLYRESCGAEWYDGNDVTGSYWPRGLSSEPLAELVSLQHKYVAYPTANAFLVSVILDVFPDMTQSSIGSQYQDIWCYQPSIKIDGYSPYASFQYSLDYLEEISGIKMKKASRYRRVHQIYSEKPKNFGMNDLYLDPHWSRELVRFAKAPHDENYEVHTTITSVTSGKIPDGERDRVEQLAYLLSIGNGIEHINSSAYTKTQDTVYNRRDLCGKRKIKIVNKKYPM